MKLKNPALILTFITLSTFPIFGQNAGPEVGPKVGDVILKNVIVDGKPTPKLVGVYSFCEYTKDGKELNGQELRLGTFLNEYDSKGNVVHRLQTSSKSKTESWTEFESVT